MLYLLPATTTDSESAEPPAEHSRPEDGRRKLWDSSSVLVLKAGQHVFRAGDPQLALYKVASGTIRLYKNLKDGRRQVIGFLFAGDLIGLELQPQHLCNAQAIGAANLDSVPAAAARVLALNDRGVMSDLYASLSNEVATARDLALTLGRANPEERLARFLVALSRRNQQHGRDPMAIDLSMPRTDIADHLGLTIETVSRTLTSFVKRRFIKLARRRSIQILDSSSLEALSEGLRRTKRRS